ncbi:hypothetical protein SAMN05421810_105129 [Amycolatopsis arida]|uniref:Uncharacterized protein n=1 Tax=Amycolatopsis arida TaxID=587909 RepID=A0A1I5WIN1_9PSEU|nr:hypothetical protein CLV69_105148 [Amycolatopsis arida]SFQ19555.1 hypothetical protein SAMN05421810_105129 [Amycolatopsis arida]
MAVSATSARSNTGIAYRSNQFSLHDQYGAEVSISTEDGTVLSLTTGCHPTESAVRQTGQAN